MQCTRENFLVTAMSNLLARSKILYGNQHVCTGLDCYCKNWEVALVDAQNIVYFPPKLNRELCKQASNHGNWLVTVHVVRVHTQPHLCVCVSNQWDTTVNQSGFMPEHTPWRGYAIFGQYVYQTVMNKRSRSAAKCYCGLAAINRHRKGKKRCTISLLSLFHIAGSCIK